MSAYLALTAAFLLAFAGEPRSSAPDPQGAPVSPARQGPVPAPAADTTIATAARPSGAADRIPAADTLRKLVNNAYSGGEYLRFDVNWSFMTVGDAYLTVTDTVYHGRKCNIVTFRLESKPFFDMFYKVRDRYRTIIDAEGLFPWRFEQHIREGGFSRDFAAEFDQRAGIATTPAGTYPIPPYVQDIMSAFYYARSIDYAKFRPGQRIELQNFYKDTTYPLGVKYKGRQRIEVDAGTFDCIIVEPLVSEGGLFKSEGRILLWITDDDRKMPVRVRAKIPIGDVDSDLAEFRGLNGLLRARINED